MHQPEVELERPTISVVIETFNASIESSIQLSDVLTRLGEQTVTSGPLELIVVLEEGNDDLARYLRQAYPHVRLVFTEDATYYGMKICGMKHAQGDVVALLDSDTLPEKNWVEEIAASISNSADIVAGRVRYQPGAPLARTANLFNYGHFSNDANGEVETINVSNAAMRREILQEHFLDPRVVRSGGGTLFGRELKSSGFRLVYNPNLRVTHTHPGVRAHIRTRLRTGYEAINICRLDEKGVLPETKYLKFGLLAPFMLAARRAVSDVRSIVANRRDLEIAVYEVPFFVLVSLIVRAMEAVTGVITVLRPQYLARKFGW